VRDFYADALSGDEWQPAQVDGLYFGEGWVEHALPAPAPAADPDSAAPTLGTSRDYQLVWENVAEDLLCAVWVQDVALLSPEARPAWAAGDRPPQGVLVRVRDRSDYLDLPVSENPRQT
jgi:hypothetical protein